MKWLGMAVLTVFLAGCGADGDPVRPEARDDRVSRDGIHISGEARIGVKRTW